MSSPHRGPTEAERVRGTVRARLDAAICAAAAWSSIATVLLTCSSGARGDDSAPLPLSVASDARPITANGPDLNSPQGPVGTLRFSTPAGTSGSPPGESSSPSGTILRWKNRQPETSAAGTGFSVPQSPGNWQERGQKNWSAIRPAAHQNAPTPFRDPFGDQSPESAATLKLLAPGGDASSEPGQDVVQTASADDVAPAPPAPWTQKSESPQQKSTTLPRHGFVPPTRFRPFVAQKPKRALQLPPLQPTEPQLPDFLQLPTEPMQPAPAGEKPSPAGEKPAPAAEKPIPSVPATPPRPSIGPSYQLPEIKEETAEGKCERIYNGRDCCEEDRKCQTAQQALRDNAITKISLDITAPFKPDAATLEEEHQMRADQLRLMPARDWRDRTGQVVASGRLSEIANRKIQVTGTDGNVTPVPLGSLSDDDLCFLAAWWGVPTECSLGDDRFNPRAWEQITFTWKASALCHKPLYFEEVAMERYGHSMGPLMDPVHSGAHFFLNIAFLPYKMGINPPHECQYALGYYRPGNCAPWLVPPVPVSLRGALLQGAAAVGVVYLFP